MINRLSIRNKKLVIILVAIAILIPIAVFTIASALNRRDNIGDIIPTPMQQVPLSTKQGVNVYEFELKIGTPITIPESNIVIELISTSNEEPDCFDCISSTIVEVRNEGDIKIWDYACGGFSGRCNNQFKQFGYVVEAQGLKFNSMLVKVYPEANE